ncbi:MAG: hypothetical protein ABIQ40_15295 [Bacteroidia bacterium]
MNNHIGKTPETKSKAAANNFLEKQDRKEVAFEFADNRLETIAQRKLQSSVNEVQSTAIQNSTGHSTDGIIQLAVDIPQVWIDERFGEQGLERDGDFVWMDGGEHQSRNLSHIHLFSITKGKITGQLTIRNAQADNGGIAFDSVTIGRDSIVAEVINKFGADAPGQEHRKEVVDALKGLIDALINVWQRWKIE